MTPEHHIWKLFGRGCCLYNLLEEGDRVVVALSGGKDSLALTQMMGRRASMHVPHLEAIALHVVMDNIPYASNLDYLHSFCKASGMKLEVLHTHFDATTDHRKTPCYLCSHHRRKALFEYATRAGYNKVALGHHQDDILTTLLMSMTHEGALSAMPPMLKLHHYPLSIIRPLCMVPEHLIRSLAEAQHYEQQQKACPHDRATRRTEIAAVLHHLESLNPEARYNLWRAMRNIKPLYLP